MQQNKPKMFSFQLFAAILICTLLITTFSQMAPRAYERVFQEEGTFSEGTYIGSIEVQGLSEQDAVTKVNDGVADWQKTNKISLSFADQKIELPSQFFHFQVEDSIASASSGRSTPLFVFVKDKELKEQLALLADEKTLSFVDMKGLLAKLEEEAGNLSSSSVTLKLTDFMSEAYLSKKEVLAQSDISITETQQLSAWLNSHSEVVIPSNINFSFLDILKDEEQTIYTNDFLSKLSSGIYRTVLSTNLQIVERHISKEFPDGFELGYEAKIMLGKMDLILFNPNDMDITIQFKKKNNNTVTVTALSLDTGYSYKTRTENKKTYEPKKIYQYVADLSTVKKNQSKVGKKGYSIKIYRDCYDADGALLKSELVSEDFYLPVNEVVLKEIGSPDPVVEDEVVTEENGDNSTNDELNSAKEDLESLQGMIEELEKLKNSVDNP